jgi:hypothetical protein
MLHALAVVSLILLTIWILAPRIPRAAGIIGFLLAVYALCQRGARAGFAWTNFQRALQTWRWGYASGALLFLLLAAREAPSRATVLRSVLYFVWCLAQQLVYQQLICAPLVAAFGSNRRAQWTTALCFSVVHAPNPVLMPATLLWGAAAWSEYREERSLWAVALWQYVLSGLLNAVIPYAWHHGFRIGPGFFRV